MSKKIFCSKGMNIYFINAFLCGVLPQKSDKEGLFERFFSPLILPVFTFNYIMTDWLSFHLNMHYVNTTILMSHIVELFGINMLLFYCSVTIYHRDCINLIISIVKIHYCHQIYYKSCS